MEKYGIEDHLDLVKSINETPNDEHFIGIFRRKLATNQQMIIQMVFRVLDDRESVITTLMSMFPQIADEFCGHVEKEAIGDSIGAYFLTKLASFCEVLEEYTKVIWDVEIKTSENSNIDVWKQVLDGKIKFCLLTFVEVCHKAPVNNMMVEYLIRHGKVGEDNIKIEDIRKMLQYYGRLGETSTVLKLWKMLLANGENKDEYVKFLVEKQSRFERYEDVENVFVMLNITTDVAKFDFVRKNMIDLFPKKMSFVFVNWLLVVLTNVQSEETQRFWDENFTQVRRSEFGEMVENIENEIKNWESANSELPYCPLCHTTIEKMTETLTNFGAYKLIDKVYGRLVNGKFSYLVIVGYCRKQQKEANNQGIIIDIIGTKTKKFFQAVGVRISRDRKFDLSFADAMKYFHTTAFGILVEKESDQFPEILKNLPNLCKDDYTIEDVKKYAFEKKVYVRSSKKLEPDRTKTYFVDPSDRPKLLEAVDLLQMRYVMTHDVETKAKSEFSRVFKALQEKKKVANMIKRWRSVKQV